MTSEKEIQNQIRCGINDIAVLFRANVGNFMTADGRMVSTGLPKGFPDLFGYRKSDNKIVFIECKNEKGRLRPEQKAFLERAIENGCCAGVARSLDDARKIILTGGVKSD